MKKNLLFTILLAFIGLSVKAQTNISWQYKAAKTTAMQDAASATYNNSIYVLGGSNLLTSNYLFDAVANTWTSKASIPNGSDEGGAAVIGTNIYLVHGTSDENMRVYNISTD